MLVKFEEYLHVDVSAEDAWKLLRDTPRLASLLPGVENVASLNASDGHSETEAYAATVNDKIGPFKVTMKLEVRVLEAREPVLKASLKGADSLSQNRVTGSLQVILDPVASGTRMHFEASVEILGKLATLGAVPMRRRTTQLFEEFARNIQGQFGQGQLGPGQVAKERS